MSEHLTDVDQLPEGWISLERAYQFLRERLSIDGSDFITERWDCKYINARVDMRTGRVLLTPGNVQ